MLKDITLGQYFPMDSVVHKMDARYKLIITVLFLVMLFWGQRVPTLLFGLAFVVLATVCSKIPPKMLVKSIRPIVPILIFTGMLNLFLLSGGEVLWQWKFLKITEQGVQTSVFMVVRICLLIAGTSLLTYTTSPIVLTDAIEALLSPLLKCVGVALLSQLASAICLDAGQGALAKTVELGGAVLALTLSLPLISAVLSLLEQLSSG